MDLSNNGIALLKKLEGFRDHPYLDEAGNWTIGYGTRVTHDSDGSFSIDHVDNDSATALLIDRIRPVVTTITRLVTTALTQNQFDAICIFMYNVGVTAFRNSTMLALLNKGDIAGASNEFGRWIYEHSQVSEGLKHRREAEKALFDAVA